MNRATINLRVLQCDEYGHFPKIDCKTLDVEVELTDELIEAIKKARLEQEKSWTKTLKS